MLFKGRLRLPSDPGEGIPIDLELEDVILSLVSEGEDFGEWRLDQVEIRRLFSNQFALLLDGEEMVFVANDALGFAYDGLTFVEEVTGRLSKRRLFKGRKSGKRQSSTEEPEPVDDAASDAATESERVPAVVPFFPEPAQPVASALESPAIDPPAEPAGRQMSDLVSDEPAVVEVASSMNSVQVAPAMPAGDLEPIIAEPLVPTAPITESAVPEPIVSEASVSEMPAAVPAANVEPIIEPIVALEDDEEEEAELVIEDVAAYGYVPPVATRSREERSPGPVPEPASLETEPVTESVEAPAARAPEMHPLGEVDPVTEPVVVAASESAEVAAEAASVNHATLDAGPSIEIQVEAVAPEPVAAVPASPAPPAQPRSAPDFAQWSSNGHAADVEGSEVASANGAEASIFPDAEVGDSPQTQKSGRHARSDGRSRSGSLFGRKRSREPEEHEHRYESSKTVGGITRRICAVCDHVSFAGEDVYQGW